MASQLWQRTKLTSNLAFWLFPQKPNMRFQEIGLKAFQFRVLAGRNKIVSSSAHGCNKKILKRLHGSVNLNLANFKKKVI